MRRQRSAGRDRRHCHGHGGDTHGVVLPHHNTPGPVRAATPQQRGSCIIASVRAGGTGRGHETCSSQRNGATRNRPASRCTSDAPPPGAGTCYCGASSMANASRRNRWCSRRPSRAHRAHDPHCPSAPSSGSGPHDAHELREGGVRPALDPALHWGGLALRPRFDEAEEQGDDGYSRLISSQSTVTRVENSLIWSDELSTATRRSSARRRSRSR